MSVRLHLYCFVRKFVFDVLPAALASLVGALFFAHQWTQTPARVDVARVTAQNEQIVTMIRDEQTLIRTLLAREHELAAQRQTSSQKAIEDKEAGKDVRDKADKDRKVDKDKVETTASVRRRVEPPHEASRAVAITPPAATRPAAEPPTAVTSESGPLAAAPEPEGIITRIVSATVALTQRAVETSGVPSMSGLMPIAPAMARPEAWPSGHLLDTKR